MFDVIRRYLEWLGFEVTYVQNVTDVDDKIIAAATREGVPTEEVARRSWRGLFRGLPTARRATTPTIEPAATEHIPEMIEMIEPLIEHGHAYAADGDVYFAVAILPGYGKLSGRDIDELQAGARVEPGEHKRDPLDFAVWKAAKPGEPQWDSPWGRGRPGWHIECSAMARRYLGARLRHSRRRPRPDLSPPRERDRPVRGCARSARSPATGCTTAWSTCPERRCRSRPGT